MPRFCGVIWKDELADELVVFAMGAKPEPMDTAWNRKPECPVIVTNSDAVKFAVVDRLEMQRWVRWIGL